jgi:hypothetical protein
LKKIIGALTLHWPNFMVPNHSPDRFGAGHARRYHIQTTRSKTGYPRGTHNNNDTTGRREDGPLVSRIYALTPGAVDLTTPENSGSQKNLMSALGDFLGRRVTRE